LGASSSLPSNSGVAARRPGSDVVGLRLIAGVDRRRRHHPLGAIQRFADLGELALRFEGRRALLVA